MSSKKIVIEMRKYSIVDEVVEGAVRLGWRRAIKHLDEGVWPDEDMLVETMRIAVMNDLLEVIDFDK